MLNYKKGKTRYKPNNLGSLYIDEKNLTDNDQPIIYIGGQMEHRCHILEQTGYTADPGHNMFNGSWFYDYPITAKNKSLFNAENFANNLVQTLEEANLHDIILLTESFGGTIAALATQSDRVAKVIAIHPSITGTPLANPTFLATYKQDFDPKQKLILAGINFLINQNYGFEMDNFLGIDLSKTNLDKILVVGSSINKGTEQNPLILQTNDMLEKVTGYKNDGIVLFDERQLANLGINYLVEPESLNHFAAGSKENIERVYQKTLCKK